MKDTTRIKLPSEVIQEEEGAISTTASVAVVDKPLGKKPLKRFEEAVLGDGDGKPRHCLPQISDYYGFVDAVEAEGGVITDETVDPEDLTPTQSNFNQEKVARIVSDGPEKLLAAKPVIVSDDVLYSLTVITVWLAAIELGIDLPVRRVSLDIEQLHDICDGADFVEKKKLNEHHE